MSNSHSKSRPGAVKNMRQGIYEQTPVHGKKHIKRPYKIVGFFLTEEMTLGHYATKEDAEKALSSYQHKGYNSIRIVGPEVK